MANTPNDWSEPDWNYSGKVHEWKNYISQEIRETWGEFTDAQKQALARQAEDNASDEEWD